MNDFKKRYRIAGGSKRARSQQAMALRHAARVSQFATRVEESTKHLCKIIDEARARYRNSRSLIDGALAAEPARKAAETLTGSLADLQSTMNEALRALKDADPAKQIAQEIHQEANAAIKHVADQRALMDAALRSFRRQSELARLLLERQARVAEAMVAMRQSQGAMRSTEALARARDRLLSPGVKLDIPSDIPRYHADPDVPGRLIRVLRGKREPGRFVEGQFRPEQ